MLKRYCHEPAMHSRNQLTKCHKTTPQTVLYFAPKKTTQFRSAALDGNEMTWNHFAMRSTNLSCQTRFRTATSEDYCRGQLAAMISWSAATKQTLCWQWFLCGQPKELGMALQSGWNLSQYDLRTTTNRTCLPNQKISVCRRWLQLPPQKHFSSMNANGSPLDSESEVVTRQ